MPISARSDGELRLIDISGEVTEADLAAFWRDEYTAGYRGMHSVVDLRAVTRLDIRADGVARVAGVVQRDAVGQHRVAIVASNPLTFGLARVYEGHSSKGAADVHVFRTIEAAHAWARTGHFAETDRPPTDG